MTIDAELTLRNILSAITNWLEYKRVVIKTKHVLSEHSICVPISDYLERDVNVSLELEKMHEKLAKKRVDAYWTYAENEKFYMELKMATGYSSDILSDYYDDLCRLSLLINDDTYCYFLVAGSTESFDDLFFKYINSRLIKRPIFKWLSLDMTLGKKTRNINLHTGNKIRTNQSRYINCLYEFYNEYEDSYQKKTGRSLRGDMQPFNTELIAYNNYGIKNMEKKAKNSIALWRIYR